MIDDSTSTVSQRWQFHPVSALETHDRSWRALNRSCGNSPLLDPAFLHPLIDEFAGADHRLALLGDPQNPTAMAIVALQGRGAWQTFQPANAPLGAWLSRPGLSLSELLGGLLHSLPGISLVLGATQLDPDIFAREGETASFKTLNYIETARVVFEGDFEDYWKARGKNLRHNISRQTNRLAREGVTHRLEQLREPAAMAGAVADYARLEMASWKGAAQSAVDTADAQGRFYCKMLEDFARQNEAVVFRYWYDDALVATDLCLEREGTLIILKTTYDETRKGTSPAHLMRYEVVREAFATRRWSRLEFYGPAQDWHRRWTDDIRTMYHANRYRWGALARLHQLLRSHPAA